MRNVNARFDNLDAYVAQTTAGFPTTRLNAVRYGAAKGVTLVGATNYYFPIGSSESGFVAECPLIAVHVQWAAALVAAFTIEGSNFPFYECGTNDGAIDNQDWDPNTGGLWVPINPVGAWGGSVGTGAAYANSGVTAAGTGAGAGVIVLPSMPFRRVRVAAVVTTGALVRVGTHGILVEG